MQAFKQMRRKGGASAEPHAPVLGPSMTAGSLMYSVPAGATGLSGYDRSWATCEGQGNPRLSRGEDQGQGGQVSRIGFGKEGQMFNHQIGTSQRNLTKLSDLRLFLIVTPTTIQNAGSRALPNIQAGTFGQTNPLAVSSVHLLGQNKTDNPIFPISNIAILVLIEVLLILRGNHDTDMLLHVV